MRSGVDVSKMKRLVSLMSGIGSSVKSVSSSDMALASFEMDREEVEFEAELEEVELEVELEEVELEVELEESIDILRAVLLYAERSSLKMRLMSRKSVLGLVV